MPKPSKEPHKFIGNDRSRDWRQNMAENRMQRSTGDPVQQAFRKAMLRDIEAMSRRSLLKRGGLFATAGAMFAAGIPLVGSAQEEGEAAELPEITEIPENLRGTGQVAVASWGGTFQDAQREAYFRPFEELSGIRVVEAEGPSIAQVQAMVDTGNIEWDVVQLDRSSVINLERKGDYWEEIDYSLFDTDHIDEAHRYRYSVDMLPYAQILGYRTDEYPDPPQRWADFWDLEGFPGPRTMIAGTGGVTPFLEAALIADGVPADPDELYPIDIDRAYDSLSRVRDGVVRWWEAGAIPAQMLTDREATMAVIWNGRMQALLDEGVPVAPQWNEGALMTDVWAIPRGAPNAENAQKFAAFITMAIPQARLSKLIPYGSVNDQSSEYMTEAELESFISGPAIAGQLFNHDPGWWADNLDAVLERWNEWILG
jgi:putative spermidine/putrescine transport system substrate-binding protein